MSKPLTKREAADYLRATERTLDRYRAEGLIRAVKAKGKVLFPQEQLEGFFKKHIEK